MAICREHEAFRVELPQTAVEWADQHFYLSAESSGSVGRWETLPFQRAILNAMGSPDVQKVFLYKSARVGFTKMLMAASGYFLVKKKRSVCIWQPTDDDRNEFSKDEIANAIRDVPAWRNAFPAYNKKSQDNTTSRKAFLGSTLWLKGATSSKNFQRISPDVVICDELDRMPIDIDGEGSAEALSWKRAEVSSFRKQVLGSSPKDAGSSQIEAAADKADALVRFHVKCPHCGEFSPLEFGGKDSTHGLKWEKGKPETVLYHCRECGTGWPNGELHKASVDGFYADERTGYSTVDGLVWRRNGEPSLAPRSVAFHVWSAYSPYTTWREIIEDWIAAQSDPLALKTFVNTTLGETWEAQEGETIKPAQLLSRPREPMPEFHLVTAGVDVQADRFEVQHLGHCVNGDIVPLRYKIIPAETDRLKDWQERLDPELGVSFQCNGRTWETEAVGIDTGYQTQVAQRFCALNVEKHYLAFKGQSGDRSIIGAKPARNWRQRGLDGWIVGIDAAKDVIFARLAREDGDGRMIFPEGVELPADYFNQLTAERRTLKIVKNRRVYQYVKRSQSARNEALDLTVYGLAAGEWLRVHRRVNLEERLNSDGDRATGFHLL